MLNAASRCSRESNIYYPPDKFVGTLRGFGKVSVIFFLFLTFPLNAQNAHNWRENLFFSLSGQYYILPGIADAVSFDLAEGYGLSYGFSPLPGFRAAIGYEWRRWNFSIESGYTFIRGDTP